MQATDSYVVLAKFMLAIFIGLAIASLVALVRYLSKPIQASKEKLTAARKSMMYGSWVLFAACANAIRALVFRQYYLLFASALLFSVVLPVIIHYCRLRAALRTSSGEDVTAR
jgi:hypothetical protein